MSKEPTREEMLVHIDGQIKMLSEIMENMDSTNPDLWKSYDGCMRSYTTWVAIRALISKRTVTRELVRVAFERFAIPLTDYEDNPLALFSENAVPFLADLGIIVEEEKS